MAGAGGREAKGEAFPSRFGRLEGGRRVCELGEGHHGPPSDMDADCSISRGARYRPRASMTSRVHPASIRLAARLQRSSFTPTSIERCAALSCAGRPLAPLTRSS